MTCNELTEDQIAKCVGEGFIPEPEMVREGGGHRYYKCPCGANDHHATMSTWGSLEARPLHCLFTGRMWWVDMRRGDDIKSIMQAEEAAFRALLDRYEPSQVTAAEAVKRWHSTGIPLEVMEDDVDDVGEMYRLAEAHKATGGNNFKAVYA